MQSPLQKLPPMAANLRRDDDDKRPETTTDDERRRETTTRRKPREHSSNPQTPNYKREPFATHSGKIVKFKFVRFERVRMVGQAIATVRVCYDYSKQPE